jgi:hypothetical protein
VSTIVPGPIEEAGELSVVVYTTEADALARRDAEAAALGYPKPGILANGGTPPQGQGVTLYHSSPRKHPSKQEWAYPVDAESLAAVPLVGKTTEPLTPSWRPDPMVEPAEPIEDIKNP